jgi:hypothetical protein
MPEANRGLQVRAMVFGAGERSSLALGPVSAPVSAFVILAAVVIGRGHGPSGPLPLGQAHPLA